MSKNAERKPSAEPQRPGLPRPGSHILLSPEPRPTSEFSYHHDRAPGQKYLIIDNHIVPGIPIYVALRDVDRVPDSQEKWLDPHRHSCNSFYVFIGEGSRLEGLQGFVTLGSTTVRVEAPCAVLMPPGILHHYWLTRGSGWYLQITLAPTYEDSLIGDDIEAADTAVAEPRNLVANAVEDRNRWTFIDAQRFPDPGVSVSVQDLNALESDAQDVEPGILRLDIALGRHGDPASFTLSCHGDLAHLRPPFAFLHAGESPRIAEVKGRAIAVTLRCRSRVASPARTSSR